MNICSVEWSSEVWFNELSWFDCFEVLGSVSAKSFAYLPLWFLCSSSAQFFLPYPPSPPPLLLLLLLPLLLSPSHLPINHCMVRLSWANFTASIHDFLITLHCSNPPHPPPCPSITHGTSKQSPIGKHLNYQHYIKRLNDHIRSV